jgi:hypothetical protein
VALQNPMRNRWTASGTSQGKRNILPRSPRQNQRDDRSSHSKEVIGDEGRGFP